MKTIRNLFFLMLLLVSCYGRAQDTLRINPHALDSLNGTTFVLNGSGNGNNPTFGVWIYNVSGAVFSDSINFGYAIERNGTSTSYVASPTDSSGISSPINSVTIQPHDSVLVMGVQVHFSGPDFVIGSSTVVIWPVAAHATVILLDSASQQVTITGPNGLTDPETDGIKVYMSGQALIVKNKTENIFGGIRIYNAIGQLMTERELSQYAAIPMEQYADGIYMVEIRLADGKRAVYKVAKTSSP